jgi:AraC family ethanolamine operon transcriptional activator
MVAGRFGDADELSEAVKGWALDLRQLDGGASQAELVQVSTPSTVVFHSRLARCYDQRGEAPEGTLAFGIPDGWAGTRWCGHDLTDATIPVFGSAREFEARTMPAFGVYTVAVSEQNLRETAETLGLPYDLVGESAVVADSTPDEVSQIRQALRFVFAEIRERPTALEEVALRRHLDFEVPALILRAVLGSRITARPSSSVREYAWKRARDWIESHPDEPLTVRELCHATGASWRTLDYAFREYTGVSPKSYLLAVRLNAVRRELRAATGSVRISEVASRWGFWHMSQFAMHYRNLFGELPSETLCRATSS